jgi:hypothetical protein
MALGTRFVGGCSQVFLIAQAAILHIAARRHRLPLVSAIAQNVVLFLSSPFELLRLRGGEWQGDGSKVQLWTIAALDYFSRVWCPVVPLGIEPRRLETLCCYNGVFTCGGGETIACELVEDGYCDCADGSDEWTTAACSGKETPGNGIAFWCDNEFGSVPLSRVGDGVCDCPCGEDEQVRIREDNDAEACPRTSNSCE